MSSWKPARPLRLCISLVATVGLLAGCAPGQFSTQSSRIGVDDGTDSCRVQLVALDSTGNFFGAQILTGAAIGAAGGGLAGALIGGDIRSALIGAAAGAALGATTSYLSALQRQNMDQAAMFSQVQGDLSRENAQIDRTQLAFDQLTDCRFRQAEKIRADYATRRIDRPTALGLMVVVKQRAQRDLALAKQINGQIGDRGQQFEVAADSIVPGTKAAADTPSPAKQTTVRRAAPLKLRPDPGAPDIGQLAARQPVTVTPDRSGYALVQTASGERGYAPVADLQGATSRSTAPTQVAAGSPDEVRTLAGSNAARRDTFAQSVAVTEQASNSGFELAG